nr:hypothetical protein [Tanacetum cinerariifolium]
MMNGDTEEEEDALVDILKTVVEEFIDMLEEPDERILFGRPFLATIHAQIDVFRGEISLGVGNEKVMFDMNGEICHSRDPIEKFYMVSSIQESEYFNPHEMENDDSPALEQRTCHYNEESVCKEDFRIWPTCNPDLRFCSGYDAIYGKEGNGMLKQWICFRDHVRQNVRGKG